MYYKIKQGVLTCVREDAIAEEDHIAILSQRVMRQELQQGDEYDRMIAQILDNEAMRYENHNDMDVLCIHIHKQLASDERCAIHIFIQSQSLWFVSSQAELLDAQMHTLLEMDQKKWSLHRVLYHFLDHFFEDESKRLDVIQKEILQLEDLVISNKADDQAVSLIIGLRKRLLRQERAYEQMQDALDHVLLNVNQLFDQEDLRLFTLLDGRCDRLAGRVSTLQDYVTEIREAYQACVDINLNVTMRIFTVITAVFLPLTLIAGWYGMNLKMPEYAFAYGYPMVMGISVLITIGLLVYFKSHRWF